MARIKIIGLLSSTGLVREVARLLEKKVTVPDKDSPYELEIPRWVEEDRQKLEQFIFEVIEVKI